MEQPAVCEAPAGMFFIQTGAVGSVGDANSSRPATSSGDRFTDAIDIFVVSRSLQMTVFLFSSARAICRLTKGVHEL